MAHEILNSKIAEVAAAIQVELQEEEVPVITFYQSGDELVFMDTTDNKGISSNADVGGTGRTLVNKPFKRQGPGGDKKRDGKGQKGEQGEDGEDTEIQQPPGLDDEQEGRDDIKLSGEGEGDDEDDGNGQGGSGQDGDGNDSDNQIKIGTKVRIKSTGLEGVVTGINNDGTFAVSPLPPSNAEDKKEAGGALSPVIPLMSAQEELIREEKQQQENAHPGIEILGDFPEDELEIISPESKGGKGKDKGKPQKGKGKGQKGEQGEQGEDGEDGEDGENGENGEQQGDEGEQGEGQGQQRQQQGQGQGEPPPASELDAEELRQRVEEIKNTLLKLPTFAFRFFGERIEQEGEMFTMKSSLALMERFARSVFSKKNAISTADGNKFLSKTAQAYFELLEFYKRVVVFRDGEYYISEDSLYFIEQWFESNNLQDIWLYCQQMDETFRMDSDYYRFMTLAAFSKPELFGNNFMNIHMDLVFRYFRANILPVASIWSICFDSSLWDFQKIYERSSGKLDLYSVLRTPDRMDFIILASSNLLKDVSDYKKYTLSELPEKNKEMLININDYAMSFYRSTLALRDNYTYWEIVMKNINFLLDLQNQRFRDVLIEVALSAS